MNGPRPKPIYSKKYKEYNKYSDVITSISFVLLFLLIAIISLNIFTVEESNITSTNGIVTNIWLHQSKLEKLQENQIKYLFVDIGDISPQGKIKTAPEEIAQFLESVRKYEKFNNYNFIILPYTEIILGKYSLSEEFKLNLIKEYQNLINLGFNGAFVDIEKIPLNEKQDYLSFIEKLNKNIPQNSILAVYSGHLNDKDANEWEWDFNLYNAVASKADLIIMPGYDASFKQESSYISNIENQMKKIEEMPASKAKFMLGVPTHKQYPETLKNSLYAYKNHAKSNSNFIGISIFAEWTTDEEEWETYKKSLF